MKKRLLTLLLALVLIFTALPGFASAAGVRETSAEVRLSGSAAPAAGSTEGLQARLYTRLNRLTGLTGTKTFTLSEATRNAVCDKLVSGFKAWAAVIDVSEFEITVGDFLECYNRVYVSHYELFYVDNCTYNAYDGIVYEIIPVYKTKYTKSDVTVFNNRCNSIIAGVPNGTDAEKLLYLHDWLVTHCEYDVSLFTMGSSERTDAYAALVEGCAVCEGYAKAYKLLCDMARLECEFVNSGDLNHAWNVVQVKEDGIENAHYYIDCTWDDPVNEANGLTAEMTCSHEYFLLCKEEFMTSHGSNDWRNGDGELVYNYTTTEYFKYGNGWWRKLNRAVQWIGSKMCYAKKNDVEHVYFRNSGATTETAVTIQGGGEVWHVWGNPSYYVDPETHSPASNITVAAADGAYYYCTPTQIWKLTTGDAMTLAYTLSSAEQAKGYLYGLQAGSGELTYYIGRDPGHPSVATGKLSLASALAVNSITVNKTSANIGEKLTWTASAAGGSGTLRYCFYVYQDGAVVYNSGYGTAASVSYTPTAAGTYKAKVFVKDSAGKSASRLSGNTTVAAAATPISITAITPNKTSSTVGEKLTWTAAAAGGSGTLRYCFYVYQDGAVVYNSGYGTAASVSYTPTAAGTYKAKVFVKDSAGKSASRLSGNTTVTAAAAVLTVTGITPNKTSAATGEEITWTVTASGGSGTLKYNFYLYQDGVVTYKSGYGSAKSIGYTPSEAGTYAVKVFVKDGAGKTASKMSVNVTAIAPLEITEFNALTTWVMEGEDAIWTATAVGGSGQLLYNFYVYRDGSVVSKSGYTASNTYYYPTYGIGTTYNAKVFVKDGAGKVVSMMCTWPVYVHGA